MVRLDALGLLNAPRSPGHNSCVNVELYAQKFHGVNAELIWRIFGYSRPHDCATDNAMLSEKLYR